MNWPNTFSENQSNINIIIETPKLSQNKFAYDPETDLFKLKKILPSGCSFPFHMGFIPYTRGEDGDPLDAIVLMNQYTFPGCWVECRLLGGLTASQREKGKKAEENNRFVFVPAEMKELDHLKTVKDLNKNKLDAISEFFKIYNSFYNIDFRDHKWIGVNQSMKLIKKNRL